jgi:hypothetical protein
MKATINIATYPARYNSLLKTLESLKGQAEIRIYLNEYTEVPKELQEYTTHIGDNLTDNGKFFWANNKNEYYFTCDDDIIYPKNYVQDTLSKYRKGEVLTYHGRTLLGVGRHYYGGHRVYNCLRPLSKDIIIDVGGTGVMMHNTNEIRLDIAHSKDKCMSDLVASYQIAKGQMDIRCLAHPIGYFQYTENDSSIFDNHHKVPTRQNQIADEIYRVKYPSPFA